MIDKIIDLVKKDYRITFMQDCISDTMAIKVSRENCNFWHRIRLDSVFLEEIDITLDKAEKSIEKALNEEKEHKHE